VQTGDLLATLLPEELGSFSDSFGFAVAMSGHTLLASSPISPAVPTQWHRRLIEHPPSNSRAAYSFPIPLLGLFTFF
jgi:hypothetical protein